MPDIEIKKEFIKNGKFKITTIEPKNPDRDFKGVWIPKEIWLDKGLTWMEKLFLTEINSLDNENGCFASNKYFSNFFSLTDSRCSQIINSLIKKKYLSVKYINKKESKEIEYRVLNILNTCIKNIKQGIKDIKGGYLENAGGYLENDKDINTINNIEINNTINNIYNEKAFILKATIDYLNEIAKKKFSYKSIKFISARYDDGFRLEDFKKVILVKSQDKFFIENPKHLNPVTLFRPDNFEKYLNEDIKQNEDDEKFKVVT
jgi:uncharacterized phage protein (TIGR02220 family)